MLRFGRQPRPTLMRAPVRVPQTGSNAQAANPPETVAEPGPADPGTLDVSVLRAVIAMQHELAAVGLDLKAVMQRIADCTRELTSGDVGRCAPARWRRSGLRSHERRAGDRATPPPSHREQPRRPRHAQWPLSALPGHRDRRSGRLRAVAESGRSLNHRRPTPARRGSRRSAAPVRRRGACVRRARRHHDGAAVRRSVRRDGARR
jgi:hypothetical protein